MGRALRTVPVVVGEAQIEIDKRAIYDECNLQAYSVIIRIFTTENSGFCDSSGAIENDVTPFGNFWSNSIAVLRRITSPISRLLIMMCPYFDKRRGIRWINGLSSAFLLNIILLLRALVCRSATANHLCEELYGLQCIQTLLQD
jgi:hypothetical protein